MRTRPRIVSGIAKNIRLEVPQHEVRPVTERVKHSIFNTLGELLKGAKVLDLYAGSGNLGLEALSRGAKLATFVEADQDVIEVLKRNILSTGLQDAALVKHTTVEKFLQAAASKFDIILVDPPFKSAKYFPIELLPRVMNPDAAAVLKLPPKTELPDPQQLERVYQQDVGSNVLIYYRK